ncbi:hypothetical protein Btru_019207 [Bulinus truncatus]|nr:hypothetical protein Btru_019207 [Bulinus truncatus]
MAADMLSTILVLLILFCPGQSGQTSKSDTCEYDLDLTRNTIKISCVGSPSLVNIYAQKAVVQEDDQPPDSSNVDVQRHVMEELRHRPGRVSSRNKTEDKLSRAAESSTIHSNLGSSSRDQRPRPSIHWDRKTKQTDNLWDVMTATSQKLENAKKSFSVYAESIKNISGQLAEGDYNLRQDMENLRRTSNSATGKLPTSNSVTAKLPTSNSVTGKLPTSNSVTGKLPTSNSATSKLPTSNSVTVKLPTSNSATGKLPTSNSATGKLPTSNQATAHSTGRCISTRRNKITAHSTGRCINTRRNKITAHSTGRCINTRRNKITAHSTGRCISTRRNKITAHSTGRCISTRRNKITAHSTGRCINTRRNKITAHSTGRCISTRRNKITAHSTGRCINTRRNKITAHSTGRNSTTAWMSLTRNGSSPYFYIALIIYIRGTSCVLYDLVGMA